MARTWDTQNLKFNEVWADRAQRGFFLKRWDPSWATARIQIELVGAVENEIIAAVHSWNQLWSFVFAPRERMGVLFGRKLDGSTSSGEDATDKTLQEMGRKAIQNDAKLCIALKQNEKRGKQDSVAWFLQTFQTHLYHLSGAELRSGENLPVEDPVAAPKPRVAAGACSQNGKSWDSDYKFLKRKWKKMRKNDDKNEVKVTAKPRLLPPWKMCRWGTPTWHRSPLVQARPSHGLV